jgi:hypothetical protein
MQLTKFAIILIIFLLNSNSFATKQIEEVNYFASLRSSETNVRSGPGSNYPIKFSYKLRNIPVKIVSEYDNWYEIQDYEGEKGWVMQSLITKKRFLMTYSNNKIIDLYSKKNTNSKIIYHLENYVIGEYIDCENIWCQIKINEKKGWVLSKDLFGNNNIQI